MITVEDKLQSFKEMINDDIESKMNKELEDIQKETEKIVKEYEAKRFEDMEKSKREFASRLESRTQMIYSKTIKEGQEILLSCTKQIYEEFFKDLKNKLKINYSQDLGENYLKNKLMEVKDSIKSDDILYVSNQTYDRDKSLIQSIIENANVQKKDDIKIGGFEIENRDKTYKLNYSLDFLLEIKYMDIYKKVKQELEGNMNKIQN